MERIVLVFHDMTETKKLEQMRKDFSQCFPRAENADYIDQRVYGNAIRRGNGG